MSGVSLSNFFKHLTCTIRHQLPRRSHRLFHRPPPSLSSPTTLTRPSPPFRRQCRPCSASSSASTAPASMDSGIPPYHSVLIRCRKDVADSLSEALLCFGANSVSMDDHDDYNDSDEVSICSIFTGSGDVKSSISRAADSIGMDMPSFELLKYDPYDWIKRTQESFDPVEVTKGLWIVPEWKTPPDLQATNIILNPGLAFGTGEHATTKMCLQLLHQTIKGGERFLDYGTGSGILSIAAVKGLIYCGSCYDFTPIKGAVAKISCEAEGYMAETFSMLSPKTDENGYFLATFTPEQLGSGLKPSDCKVILESSPSHSCNIATNTNLGKTGVPLTYSRNLDGYMRAYSLELYSVPAFVYTTKAKCEKPNYYKVPLYTPKPSYKPMTYTPESTNKKVPTIYGVQGIIYCGCCYDLTPIEGGVAKISCKADGYKTATFSMLTPKTDKHGYFLALFTPKQLGAGLMPTDCKVTLKSSPSPTCKIATNINLGKTGAPLTHSRTVDYNKKKNTMELYSVPAFVYTSTAKCDKA